MSIWGKIVSIFKNRSSGAVSTIGKTVSDEGLKLLVEFESNALKAYNDPAGYKTIGVGHKLTRHEFSTGLININGRNVPWGNGITLSQSEQLHRQDLKTVEGYINGHVEVDRLTQWQFDALACLVFNIGIGSFSNSTLMKKLRLRLFDEVPAEFRKWNKITINGQKIKSIGLARRREAEIKLWTRTT